MKKPALAQAVRVLAPGGSLHIVDFGGMSGLPAPFRAGMQAWLARFHVSPRLDLAERAGEFAAQTSFVLRSRQGPGGYYTMVTLGGHDGDGVKARN